MSHPARLRSAALLAFLALVAALVACYPNEFTSVEELDVIATIYDPETFPNPSFSTYAMPNMRTSMMKRHKGM